MDNEETKIISEKEYKNILASLERMSSEDLVKTFEYLHGKSCQENYSDGSDCGFRMIIYLITRDWGRSFAYVYSKGQKEFFQSKCVSDFFKDSIKKILSKIVISEKVKGILNSDKTFNDMTEDEIRAISLAMKEHNKQADYDEDSDEYHFRENIFGEFKWLLYKLNGKGPRSFIKNGQDNMDLASDILLTSGLTDYAGYFSGRGVNRGDLSERNLVSIFNKLLQFDEKYAIEFVKLVEDIPTLGATEFINAFLAFAQNGFETEKLDYDDNNVSLDGVYGESMYPLAIATIGSLMGRDDDEDNQVKLSDMMKRSFISSIRNTLKKIDPNFISRYGNINSSTPNYFWEELSRRNRHR